MPLALSAGDPRRTFLDLLDRHASGAPDAHVDVKLFRAFVLDHADCFERSCAPGHVTGSAWLVDPAGERVLLTHHRKLDRWLQLGGHADGDADIARVALREAAEESGLNGLAVDPVIFDLDRHRIPARGSDPAHWHYDVRFVVRATGGDAFAVSDESHELAWRSIAGVAAEVSLDPSLRRMARKWLVRHAAGDDTDKQNGSPLARG